MFRLLVSLSIVFLGSIAATPRTYAQNTVVVQGAPPVPPPGAAPYPPYGYAPGQPYVVAPPPYLAPYRPAGSIFGFAYRGMFTGALTGLGASYLAVRGHEGGQNFGERRGKARVIGLSVGIGALAGTAVGLGLGMLDRVGLPSAYYVSRDMTYGVLFGTTVGLVSGGVAALAGGDGESVLLGMSIGSLGGIGLGLLVGIIEGQFHRPRTGALFGRRARVAVAQLGPDVRSFGPTVSGRF